MPGSNPTADRGLAAREAIESFLRQDVHEVAPMAETLERLTALAGMVA
ncbi:MAG: hypothetical protein KatS3mg014_0893 [Actinomycetota bacterium]|nr:MAG: hypothetical protein KatS3mg014_0893 [Actinomycetota bacterium]